MVMFFVLRLMVKEIDYMCVYVNVDDAKEAAKQGQQQKMEKLRF